MMTTGGTDALKVEIAPPSSFSFHSISESPPTSGIEDASYPNTTAPIATSFPDTPVAPLSILDEIDEKKEKEQFDTLSARGYVRGKYIADTLQGETFMASHAGAFGEVVIKKTRKDLYVRGITISKEGKEFNIREDVVLEAEMMRQFMVQSPPASLIKFYSFFEDAKSYYLVMENGGRDFFDFVVDCHALIASGKLRVKEWRRHCKFMFAQMVECIEWLHNTVHYCHLDISLENILISNQVSFDEESGTLSKCHLKFIDFGLAQQFNLAANPRFLSKKFVGKTHYKSPQVYAKKEEFEANKADVWSLGICLFMMIIGAPPCNRPHHKDRGFKFIKQKKMTKLLYSWNRIKYVTPNLFDLMERMLCCDEQKRIHINDIMKHDWCKIYFPNKQNTTTTPSQYKRFSVTSSTPMSPTMPTPTTPKAYNFAPNSMKPQTQVSMSVRSVNTPRKGSSSSPYPQYTARTPTPVIIESQTSDNDYSAYVAAIDHPQNNKRKKKKKFFKLSLSIFKK